MFGTGIGISTDAVINTCCLKTHRFGGHFTLSVKNSIGMVAKYVPGDTFNYMGDLHSSPHQRRMIAEVNAAYQASLVLMDGVEALQIELVTDDSASQAVADQIRPLMS